MSEELRMRKVLGAVLHESGECSQDVYGSVRLGGNPMIETRHAIAAMLALIDHLEADGATKGEFRCHNCKNVVASGAAAPDRCPKCWCRDFSAVAPSPLADGGVEAKPAGWHKECEHCEWDDPNCPECDGKGSIWTDQPCTLAEAPVGLFWCGDTLAVKSEYGNNEGRIDAFIVSSGEFFWGAQPQTIASQRASLVMPIDDEYAESRLSALPVLGVGR